MNKDAANALDCFVTYASWLQVEEAANANGGWLPGWTQRSLRHPGRSLAVERHGKDWLWYGNKGTYPFRCVLVRNAAMADYEQYLEPLP